MDKYVVISSNSIDEIVKKVNQLINSYGYKPLDGITYGHGVFEPEYYVQALLKDEK